MKKRYLLVIICIVLLDACSKFTQIDPPSNQLTPGEVFSDSSSATVAVEDIYSIVMSTYFGMGYVTMAGSISSDELQEFSPSDEHTQLLNNQLLPTNSITSSLWSSAYQAIDQANACIEGLSLPTSSIGNRKQLMAEAKSMRAFCYFQILKWFGKLPLILTTDFTKTQHISRSSVDTVYTQIEKDLEEAIPDLPESYSSGKTRMSKYAACALLARVSVNEGKWQQAADYASQTIEQSGATLPELSQVYLIGSPEALLQFQPWSLFNNPYEEMQLLRPAPAVPTYYISDSLWESFETNDGRKTAWIDSVSFINIVYHVPAKYKTTVASPPTEYYMVLRLAEQYLIRAEANFRLKKDNSAIEDLDLVRNRAGLKPLSSTLSGNELFLAIESEKRHEFFAEWGLRWQDLNRWPGIYGKQTRADEVLGGNPSKKWDATSSPLYPIPQAEINLDNNLLPQNPGYKY